MLLNPDAMIHWLLNGAHPGSGALTTHKQIVYTGVRDPFVRFRRDGEALRHGEVPAAAAGDPKTSGDATDAAQCRDEIGRLARPALEPARGIEARPIGSMERPDQRSVENLLPFREWRCIRR